MAAMYPARMSPHSRIEPASADHMPVIVYSSGVVRLLFAATKAIEKSWVINARSMATVATTAPARSRTAYTRLERSMSGRPRARP